MGVGPIPFTAIHSYFDIYDLEDFEDFSYVIRRMDKVYLELSNKEDVKNRGSKGGKKANVGDKKNNKNSR